MDFYTFRYRCCFRRTLMCKKGKKKKKKKKKKYKLLLNPCMSVRLSAFCLRIACKSLGHFDRIS